MRAVLLFGLVACLFIGTGFVQSWNTALTIFNMGLVSAIMALGVNMQWGYAGLFNVGVMGFVALGGLAAVLVSSLRWARRGPRAGRVLLGLVLGAATIVGAILVWSRMPKGRLRTLAMLAILIGGFFIFRAVFDAGVAAVEAVDPASTGYLGGLGLPVILAWPVGGLLAAGAAWIIGKTALGLRSDYLAIATLGIAEIIIAVLKNEDWLARGVKNVTGIPRPVPYEVDLQQSEGFLGFAERIGADPVTFSSITVKLSYAGAFHRCSDRAHLAVGKGAEFALGPDDARHPRQRDGRRGHGQGRQGAPPAGLHPRLRRLRRRRRDDDHPRQPACARHLPAAALHLPDLGDGDRGRVGQQLGRGAGRFPDLVALDHGGAAGPRPHAADHGGDGRKGRGCASHLIDSAAYMRLFTMGLILLLVLRFSPRGLIPER
jgi:ABC-type branched-subunit amino acid transport system permease subunit